MEPIQVLSSLYDNLSGAKWDKRKFSLKVIAAPHLVARAESGARVEAGAGTVGAPPKKPPQDRKNEKNKQEGKDVSQVRRPF